MTILKNVVLVTILINFLSSCRNPDLKLKLITKQCTLVQSETRYDCACRDYQFSYEYLGAIGQSEIVDMEVCQMMVGYPEYGDVAAFNEKVFRAIRRR